MEEVRIGQLNDGEWMKHIRLEDWEGSVSGWDSEDMVYIAYKLV